MNRRRLPPAQASLCRLYATGFSPVSNSYAIERTFARNEAKLKDAPMSVVAIDSRPGARNGAANRNGFWRRLAEALDRHFADRSARVMPATALRRSKYDIDRCRRLMHRNAMAPIGARFSNISHDRFAQARAR